MPKIEKSFDFQIKEFLAGTPYLYSRELMRSGHEVWRYAIYDRRVERGWWFFKHYKEAARLSIGYTIVIWSSDDELLSLLQNFDYPDLRLVKIE